MAAASCSRAATAGGRRGLVGLFIGRDGAEGRSRAVAACAPTSTVGRHPVGEARRGEAAVTRRRQSTAAGGRVVARAAMFSSAAARRQVGRLGLYLGQSRRRKL